MPVQTTYGIAHGIAYAGQVADQQLLNTVSKLNKSGANIPYGSAVVSDGENAATPPATGAASADVVGVVMRELNRAYTDSEAFGAKDGTDMTVITQGVVWVTAGATVAKDEDVFAGIGADVLNEYTNAAGTGVTEAVQITGAKFLTGGAAGELVKISIGLGG